MRSLALLCVLASVAGAQTRTSLTLCPKAAVAVGDKWTTIKSPTGTLCLVKDTAIVTPAPLSSPIGASGEPVYVAGSVTLLMRDDMERYTSITSMAAWPYQYTGAFLAPQGGPNTNGQPVSPGLQSLVTGRSGKAVRMSFAGCAQCGAAFTTLGLPATPETQTFYASYYARVTLHGDFSKTSLAVKWFEAWHVKNQNGRTQWNTRYASSAYRPNESQPTVWQFIDLADTPTNGDQPVGPYFNQIADGGWHRFTYAYRSNSAAGKRDGLQRMWVDGALVMDVSARAIGITPAGAKHVWCTAQDVDGIAVADGVAFVKFGDTQTTPTPPWDLDVDDLVIWRGN